MKNVFCFFMTEHSLLEQSGSLVGGNVKNCLVMPYQFLKQNRNMLFSAKAKDQASQPGLFSYCGWAVVCSGTTSAMMM